MTNHLVALSLLMTMAALGQSLNLEPKPEPKLNRFSLSHRMALNLQVSFRNIGSFTPQSDPGVALSGINHTYDDGYNLIDITGNNHAPPFENTTWNWGYQNSSQYDPSGGGSIAMHSSAYDGAAQRERTEESFYGFELAYNREIQRNDKWRWGLEGAFGWNHVEASDSRPYTASATRITDIYALNGVVPPAAPYNGTFAGPGPVLSDTPTRSTETTTVPVVGERSFEAELFGFRLGPYVEIPVHRRVTVNFSGGLAMMYVNSDFRFQETISTDDGDRMVSGSSTKNEMLFGGFINAQANAAINEDWSAFIGLQWQHLGRHDHRAPTGQAAELDLRNMFYVTFGAGYSF